MGLFSFISDTRTVRAVVGQIEPMLRGVEAQGHFDPIFDTLKIRHKSLDVIASEPLLLGFIIGLNYGFIRFFAGDISNNRRNNLLAKITLSLFGNDGVDKFLSALRDRESSQAYAEGVGRGIKIVSYGVASIDYSDDPDAAEAIRTGINVERLSVQYDAFAQEVSDERGQVVSGMLQMYFTNRFITIFDSLSVAG